MDIKAIKLCFLITTYNRPKLCRDLVSHLSDFGHTYVVNDGSLMRYDVGAYKYKRKNHGGKERYWETVSVLFSMLKGKRYDYYFFIQDDIFLSKESIVKAIDTWKKIKDPKKATLNLFVSHSRYGKPTWTGVLPEYKDFAMKTQWVDMACFMADQTMFKALGHSLPNVRLSGLKGQKSSGVGRYISQTLSRGHSLYCMYHTLAHPVQTTSLMNPWRNNTDEEDLIHDVVSGVTTASIASIPQRLGWLQRVVDSLRPQVDHIFVALNGHKKPPAFLSEGEYVMLDNSRGDAAKFYNIEDRKGYVLTCDDDIVYPRGYVSYMVNMANKLQGVVTLHGRKYPRPYRSYGTALKYIRFDQVNPSTEVVDVGGTGVMCFHKDFLDINYKDFPVPNMADIWMTKACSLLNKKIYAVKHKGTCRAFSTVDSIYNQRKTEKHGVENQILKQLYNKNMYSKNEKVFLQINGKQHKGKILSCRPEEYYFVEYKAPGGKKRAVAHCSEISV